MKLAILTLTVLALLATAASAAIPQRYTLRHPKHEHCRHGYARRRSHHRAVCVRTAIATHIVSPTSPAVTPDPSAPTPSVAVTPAQHSTVPTPTSAAPESEGSCAEAQHDLEEQGWAGEELIGLLATDGC